MTETQSQRIERRANIGQFIRFVGPSRANSEASALRDAVEHAKANRLFDFADRLMKASVQAGTLGMAGWAQELDYFSTALLETALPATVLGQLSEMAVVYPAHTRVIFVNPDSIKVQWVPEVGIKPASSAVINEGQLGYYKSAAIVVLTDEVLRVAVKGAEAALGNVAVMAAQRLFDSKLVSADAATDAAPGGLAFGVTATKFTDSALETVAAAIDKLPPSTAAPVVIARPADLLRMTSGLAANTVGVRFISSQYASAGKALVVDPASIVFAPTQIELTRSTRTTVQLSDTPTAEGNAQMVSLWQQNLVALKVEGRTSWEVTNPAAVQVAELAVA